ncbi:MAG TPA: hypothetical protein VF519_08155 [Mycobacteriales bacterium]
MIEDTLAEDVRLMLDHALATGRPVHPSWLEAARLDPSAPDAVRRLGRAHDGLAALVAPATPRTLRYLAAANGGPRRRLPLLRWLAVLSMAFLVGFVALALDSDVGSKAADFETGSGHELLVNMLFQLCAAGLGATFAALFAVNTKLRDHSLDPRDEFATWVRIVLGLVAGLVLAQLAPVDDGGRTFGRPMLALLGGFSVDVVSQTLRRLVDLASSIVAPVAETGEAARAAADARDLQLKVGVAQRLVRVRATLDGSAAAEVDALIAELAPSDVSPVVDEVPPADATAPAAPARRRAPA